jgi:hypothetical protein
MDHRTPPTKAWKMGCGPHAPAKERTSLVRAGHAPNIGTPMRPWLKRKHRRMTANTTARRVSREDRWKNTDLASKVHMKVERAARDCRRNDLKNYSQWPSHVAFLSEKQRKKKHKQPLPELAPGGPKHQSPTGYEENQPSLDLTKGNKKTTLILHREEGGMKTSLSLSLSLKISERLSFEAKRG